MRLTRCPQAAAPQHCVFLLQKSQQQDQEIAQASQLLERVTSDSDAKYDQAIAASAAIAASINEANAVKSVIRLLRYKAVSKQQMAFSATRPTLSDIQHEC